MTSYVEMLEARVQELSDAAEEHDANKKESESVIANLHSQIDDLRERNERLTYRYCGDASEQRMVFMNKIARILVLVGVIMFLGVLIFV